MNVKTIILIVLLCKPVLFFGQAVQDSSKRHVVSVNQTGYNLDWPKRFTAPLSAEGAEFKILAKDKKQVLFRGQVSGGLGDFSKFKPLKANTEYVVSVSGGNLEEGFSYPFSIGQYWLQRSFLRPALDFMIDARSVVGTHPSAYGGAPWRDGTFYSFEMPSLILQYLSGPSLYDKPPVQINYQADKKRALDPNFKYVMEPEGKSALNTVRRYYTELDAPVGQNVPDIIQLIHWGMGYYLIDPVTKDPSGGEEGKRLHPQTLEQFAYFLYGYPQYKQYFTDAFYQKAKVLVEQEWNNTGLLGVFNTVGTGKGREAPGHSIMPNLMMYEVALRDGDKDAEKYFEAAYQQTLWILKSLDLKDPKTTKGQRMSEHKLVPALVYFYQHYPERAPAKIIDKINEWVDIAISRSDNMWDFRRYDLEQNWSVPEFSETGNIAGLPAIALAAASVTKDASKKQKLEVIAAAAIDDLFGRNPQNACSAYHKDLGFSNLEKGWPKSYYNDVCARLELVRGTFSSISPTAMYPYKPEGKFGHLEGWVAFNAAWNVSLAYMNQYDTRISVKDKTVELKTPVELDTSSPSIEMRYPDGKTTLISLKETGKGSHEFSAKLNSSSSESFTLSYGYGLFRKTIKVSNENGKLKTDD